MGALHKGHESLIKKSVKESKKTLVSIFVNPRQFENKRDFKNYPKNYKNDLKILKRLKIDYLYKPSYEDIYKFKTENKIFLDRFSKKLCGKYRKGHFKGVIDVVNRFLELIKPKKILLGIGSVFVIVGIIRQWPILGKTYMEFIEGKGYLPLMLGLIMIVMGFSVPLLLGDEEDS